MFVSQPSLRRVPIKKYCLKIQSFRTISALKSTHRRHFLYKNIEFEVQSSSFCLILLRLAILKCGNTLRMQLQFKYSLSLKRRNDYI